MAQQTCILLMTSGCVFLLTTQLGLVDGCASGGSAQPGCYTSQSSREYADVNGVFTMRNLSTEGCRRECKKRKIESKLILLKQRLCICGFQVDSDGLAKGSNCHLRCEGEEKEACGSDTFVSAYPYD